MKHAETVWFERVTHRVASGETLSVSHALVVITDPLPDLDVLDEDARDYLESELRRVQKEANDIRVVPVARWPRQASPCGLSTGG